jgi:hypothetical protein
MSLVDTGAAGSEPHGRLELLAPGAPRAAPWAVAVGLVTFAAVALTTARVLLSDTYITLYAGRWISAHGIPHTDPFTVAAHGRPWVDQQWLAHVLFYQAWSIGGLAAVGALSAVAIAASFGMLAGLMVRLGVTPARAVVWSTVAFFVCATNTVTRAQSFAYPLFVLLLWLVLRCDRRAGFDRRALVGLPLLAVWANVHGSALMAAALYSAWCVYRGVRSGHDRALRAAAAYLAVAAAATAMVFVTPYAPSDIVSYYRSVLSNHVIARYIIEWFPATFGGVSLEFVGMLLIATLVLGVGIGRRALPPAPLIAATVLFAAAGVHAVRYQVWFAFPAALFVAMVLEGVSGSPPHARPGSRLPAMVPWIAASLLGAAAVAAPLVDGQMLRPEVFALSAGLVVAGDALARTPAVRRWTRRAVWAAMAAAAVSAAVALAVTPASRFENGMPRMAMARAAAYAEAHPAATVLADDVAAPAMIWHYPALAGRIGYDARLEVFSQPVLLRYMHWVSLDSSSWAAVTSGYDVLVIDRRKNGVLARRSQRMAGWATLAGNADGVALIRRR